MSGITRRTFMALLASSVLATAAPAFAQKDAEEIIIGGSMPLTGVFAFAGVAIEAGIRDYVKMINEEGGINGKPVRFIYEDTGHQIDQAVAIFNKLTTQHRNIHLYYGDSTGFSRTINPELERRGDIMLTSVSFASEINNPETFSNQFIAGPDYSQMVSILLEHIAKEKPGARIVFVNSDGEFGRDPIEPSTARAKELGLEVVEQIITPPGAVDVSTEVLKLRRARPDYTIFHGYILSPLPEFMTQARQLGLETKFMGTFWSMDSSIWEDVGEHADGFMGVMPYRYYYDDAADAPMLERIRQMRPQYQPTGYTQGFLTAMLMTEAAKRALDAGKELNGANLKAALNSIQDFDTGGIIGVPISISGNSIPVGRIYQYSASARRMEPVSDWISLKD